MDPECDIFGSPKALEITKSNVERYYAVVGVLEKWQDTLKVLEHYVPLFFKDVRKVYKTMLKEQPVNQNTHKPKTPLAIKERIKVNFTTEIEFFNFCKQRLQRQLLTIS